MTTSAREACPRCKGAGSIEATSFVDPSKTVQKSCHICKGSGYLTALPDTTNAARRIYTHWEGCWREHHDCAVAKIERLEVDAEYYRKKWERQAAEIAALRKDAEQLEYADVL